MINRRTILGGLAAAPLAALGWKGKPQKNYTAKQRERQWELIKECKPCGYSGRFSTGVEEVHYEVHCEDFALRCSVNKRQVVVHAFRDYRVIVNDEVAEVWRLA